MTHLPPENKHITAHNSSYMIMNVLPLQCRNIIPTPFLSSNKASLERPGFQWTVSAYILSNHISMFSFCWPARDASLSPPPPILPSQEKFTADENTAFPKVTLQCLCSAVAMGYQPCSKHHLFRNVLRTQREGERRGRETADWCLTLRVLDSQCFLLTQILSIFC